MVYDTDRDETEDLFPRNDLALITCSDACMVLGVDSRCVLEVVDIFGSSIFIERFSGY